MVLTARNKLMVLQKVDFIQALVTAALILKTAQACSCVPIFSSVCGYFDEADVVLHGTVLSRTEETVTMYDFTSILAKYTVDTITLFKGESGTFYPEEISFFTAESDALCGVNPTIGEEYVFGLYADKEIDSTDELGLSAYLCGLNMEWSMVDEGILNECGDDPCDGECDEFEECIYYENNGKWYCSETCLQGACDQGEFCEMKTRNWCTRSGYPGCPRKRVCTSFS